MNAFPLVSSVQSLSLQSLSHVWLFVIPWTAARQSSLPFTISQSLLKLISVGEVCNFIGSVSSQRNFEVTDQRYSPQTYLVTALGQIGVTAQFYLENKGKYILKVWWHANPKDMKRREREIKSRRESKRGSERESKRVRETPLAYWLPFLCFFSPWACPV